MGIPRFQIRPGHPDFLDLPWDIPLDDWEHERLVTMPTGVHRHPVAFVAYDQAIYAIKEMPRPLSLREFDVLRSLETRTHVAVEPAGLVDRVWIEDSSEQSAAVITVYAHHAFPYRHLLTGAGFGIRRSQMADALAGLLVELHLAGCFWGDCSLSNVLCRFDAGAVEAIMLDGETSVVRDSLSRGQRLEDIEIMKENIAGALFDVAAENQVEVSIEELELGGMVAEKYHDLWEELNGELVITVDEGYRVRQRISRLNELGFSVGQVDLEPAEAGSRVRMRIQVGGRDYHAHRLRELTGIEASENQARHILNDVTTFLARRGDSTTSARNVSIMTWRLDVFDPAISWIDRNWHGSDVVQGFCDYLVFRRSMAHESGSDIPSDAGLAAWQSHGFPGFPLEEV
jgi:hypothetical protein